MAIICPTITATDNHQYREQMKAVEGFAKRVHIDLMDGEFAPTKSPTLEHVWWPPKIKADIHLMYQRPMEQLEWLIKLKPYMVIVHNEAEVHHMHFSAELHKHDIKTGLAVLSDTPIEYAQQVMHSFDQVLIFSGHLGYHGGQADLELLSKVAYVKKHHPEVEIAWDGGINAENAAALADGGVDVLNTGGFIQSSPNPKQAYGTITSVINKNKHD